MAQISELFFTTVVTQNAAGLSINYSNCITEEMSNRYRSLGILLIIIVR